MLTSLHGLCPTYGAPLSEDENRMANRDYEHEAGEVDSGELWLPTSSHALSHAPANDHAPGRARGKRGKRRTQDTAQDTAQREPRLSQVREKRAVRLLLLALPRLLERETVWMSPHLRNLSPAMRVKIIYELEKLGVKLAQM